LHNAADAEVAVAPKKREKKTESVVATRDDVQIEV
jgi:hypothetical protein